MCKDRENMVFITTFKISTKSPENNNLRLAKMLIEFNI